MELYLRRSPEAPRRVAHPNVVLFDVRMGLSRGGEMRLWVPHSFAFFAKGWEPAPGMFLGWNVDFQRGVLKQ